MTTKLTTAIKLTTILSVVFAFALSGFCASTPPQNFVYGLSQTVSYGGKLQMTIVEHGRDQINLSTRRGAIDAYMDEQGINEVTITAELNEQLVVREDGSSFYSLVFIFGPSGCHFEPEMELELMGKYVSDDTEMLMYDQNGELVPSTRHNSGNKITFYIPHFSCYYYENYCY